MLFITVPAFGQTPFESINSMFTAGHYVSFAEAKGIYAGRCFDKKNQSLPRSSLLEVLEQDIGGDGGPEFPSKIIQKFVETGSENGNANVFDYMDAYEAQSVGLPYGLFSEIKVLNNSLSAQVANGLFTYLLRKHNDYLILNLISNLDKKGINIRGDGKIDVLKGETVFSCYYFKKLTDQ